MNLCKAFSLACIGALLWVEASSCAAQNYPSRPIRVIVPFAAGGANDLIARGLQKPLGKVLGGTVIVENIAGGSTVIGTRDLIKAAPDGHTLMLAGHLALMGYYYTGIYTTKIWEQMTILGQTGQMPWGILETRIDAPYKSWAELARYAKKNPGKLSAGGPALGGMMHLIVLETAKNSGFDITYVPYTGGGPSNIALLGGHIEYRVAQPPEVYLNLKAGKTRALAVGYSRRVPEIPDAPTFKELSIMYDIPAFGFDYWGPPNMPAALANRISKAIEQALKDPEFTDLAKTLMYQPVFVGPEGLRDDMRDFERNIGPKLEAAFPRNQ